MDEEKQIRPLTARPLNFKTERLVFWLFGFSGAAALIYEVVWARALSLILGSSVYALSTMLAAFMAGLSLGAYFGGGWADRAKNPVFIFGLLELGIAFFGVFTLLVIRNLSPIYAWIFYTFHLSFHSFSLAQFGLAFAVMIVPTSLMGATFPVVLKIRAKAFEELGQETGNVYSINTAGAILGSFLAGFVLIPLLGIRGANLTAAIINFVIALLVLVNSKAAFKWSLFGIISLIFISLSFLSISWSVPAFSFNYYTAIRYRSYRDSLSKSRNFNLLFEKEDVQGTVQVFEDKVNQSIFLVNGGKTEGSIGRDMPNQLLLAYLPMANFPEAKSFLNIGLGTGTTLQAAATSPTLTELDSVEINSAVTEAVELHFYPELFFDRRIEFITADARNYLMLTKKKYNIISSEPSYPADESVSHLFTKDFFRLVKSRLTDGGVFAQWLPYYLLSKKDAAMMVKTFAQVFPTSFGWNVSYTGDIILIGLNSAKFERPALIRERVDKMFGPGLSTTYTFGTGPEKIRRLAENKKIPINTDDRPLLEFRAAKNMLYGVKYIRSSK